MEKIKKYIVQSRLDEKDKRKFEEIRQMIHFEKLQGNHLTIKRIYAKDDSVKDSDVIRLLIREFKFKD